MILYILLSVLACTPGSDRGSDALAKSLALVPPEAGAIIVMPDLGRLNDDLGALIDATNQPAAVLAGRPIEMMKASFGIGAEFDESGCLLIWVQPDAAQGDSLAPVYLIPTANPQAFLEANFTADGSGWRNNDTELLYARTCSSHVLLSPVEQFATSYDPRNGSADRVLSRHGANQASALAKTDLLVWIDGSTLRNMSKQYEEMSQEIPFSDGRGLPPAVASAFEDSLVLVDFDPLGLSVRKFTYFDPESEFGSLLTGALGSKAPLGRLPLAPFYFAMSMDIAGMGGMKTLHRIFEVLGGESEDLPEAIMAPELEVDAIEAAVYPSRLGIALGGFFNDSALIMTGPDPQALEDHFRKTLKGLDGERGGVRYETTWTDDKELRTGGVSDAFQVKETVLPPSQRGTTKGLGDAALQRMFMQTLFGSRGLAGFAGTEGDAFILTFSQRPDVWNRALEAAPGNTSNLGKDSVLTSMRPWLMADPDIEFAIGFGSLGKLLNQLARSFPMIEPDQMPQIPEGTPPVVLNLGYQDSTAEMALVVPSGVIALGIEQVMKEASGNGRFGSPFGGRPSSNRDD